MRTVVLCPHCGFANEADPEEKVRICERCTLTINKVSPTSRSRTLAFALTALVLCPAAYLLPFMEVELYGQRTEPTIWGGVMSLIDSGSWFIAAIIFIASIVIPILKLFVLFGLVVAAYHPRHLLFNTKLHLVIDQIGKWSMIDVFLLAILVAALKLGGWTSVTPRLGAVMFALVVIFTMISSQSFDSKLLWERAGDEHQP